MKLFNPDIFSALAIAILAVACFQDGSTWWSGFCAGAAAVIAAYEYQRLTTMLP